MSSDSKSGDDGIALSDIVTWANQSRTQNRIVILDSCHSGVVASNSQGTAELTDGMTILTASTAEQYSQETESGGVFTQLLINALSGAAANLVGEITPGSVYAHIDQSLGPWDQRPVFKTNVKSFVSLRKVESAISLSDLQKITKLFPESGYIFPLDPSFEPERTGTEKEIPEPNLENTERFATLQKYNRVGIVVPIGAPHMWHAAMQSKSCRLTVLGEHYRKLVELGRI